MAVLASLQRLFLHHPLTKSHIEDAEPGCNKVTRENTEKNLAKLTQENTAHNLYAMAAASADNHTWGPPSPRFAIKRKQRIIRNVSFSETCTFICDGTVAQTKFDEEEEMKKGRRLWTTSPALHHPDPSDTPFLDRFTRKSKKFSLSLSYKEEGKVQDGVK